MKFGKFRKINRLNDSSCQSNKDLFYFRTPSKKEFSKIFKFKSIKG